PGLTVHYPPSQPSNQGSTQSAIFFQVKHFSEDELKYFLKWPEYDFWSGFVKLRNGTVPGEEHLDRFFYTTGFHGESLSDWNQRGVMLHAWRRVVDNYSEFQPTVFHEDGVYLDLIDNMATDTWQSVLGTLVCMAFVCFIFLNNLFTVAIASISVLSICAGILGILSWLGVDLDPITMAATIISIGFSVDIPAHVSYHYYQASFQEGPTSRPADRLANCLSSVAFPAVQAALSTILCVCSLMFVNLYMAGVFVKTMIICVVLCNLHGLVFLPAILIMIDSIRWALRPKGAAAQPKNQPPKVSRTKLKQNSRIAPEKSFVTDRPEV
ncbi:patched family protein, partial [Cooperia oncophora]